MYERFLNRKERQLAEKEGAEKRQLAETEQAEKLLQAVNDSARHVRNFYITFLLLALYISIIVWSTTDEMLLRISPVTLPLLNIKLPIKGFYAFAPYLFLLAHFNLLLQLNLLAGKLHQLNKKIGTLPESSQREHLQIRLFPFPFAQLLSANHQSWLNRGLLIIMVWLLILILPPFVLLLLQLGFLPFHDEDILFWQRAAIGIDLLLLWLFWPLIRSTDAKLRTWYGQASESIWLASWFRKGTPEIGWPYVEALLLTFLSIFLIVFSWGLATLPGEAKNIWGEWVPQSWWSEDENPNKEFKWTVSLFDNNTKEAKSPFHRNLQLPEKLLIANEITPSEEQALRQSDKKKEKNAALKNTRGLNLTDRDLRLANFSDAVLSRADLREAELQGADLSGANLQGAVLLEAKLQGANLRGAELQGADSRGANLQGAVLSEADLQGAVLNSAKLQGANLLEADLQGANLDFAKLRGANLIGADLQGADLIEADLQGADLRLANLRGADLSEADLQGAVLSAARLTLANLRDIRTGLLTQEEYGILKSELKKAIDNRTLLDRILQKIESRIGNETDITYAKGENILVDDDEKSYSRKLLLKSIDLEPAQSRRIYLNELKEFLADLTCENYWVAKIIAKSITSYGRCKSKAIATALLKRRNERTIKCPGLGEFDEESLEELEESAHTQCPNE